MKAFFLATLALLVFQAWHSHSGVMSSFLGCLLFGGGVGVLSKVNGRNLGNDT